MAGGDEPAPAGAQRNPWTRTIYRREGEGLEFDRVAVFADAIYAIALTLIVVSIEVPPLESETSSDEMWDALFELFPSIGAFFVAFWVIGNYWLAHHRFVGTLDSVDTGFARLHLLYLAVIAFLPFPAALLGNYTENSVAFALFATSMAVGSALEGLMFAHAHRAGLTRVRLSDQAYRWALVSSLSPVVFFVASIPVAFITPLLGVLVWLLNMPVGILLNRRMPADFRIEPEP